MHRPGPLSLYCIACNNGNSAASSTFLGVDYGRSCGNAHGYRMHRLITAFTVECSFPCKIHSLI